MMRKIPQRKADVKSSSGEGGSPDEFQVEEDYSYLMQTPVPQIEKPKTKLGRSTSFDMSAKQGNKIRVFVRTRPTSNFAHDMIEFEPTSNCVNIHAKKNERRGVVNNQLLDWSFKMDGILHNASQDQVFETVGAQVVNRALDGYNATVMCYGQTGAGKTFTMTGATENYQERGLIPRVITAVYQEIEKRIEQSVTVRISYLEIYNETMFDLLSTLPESYMAAQQMTITEDDYGVVVKGLALHMSNNEEEALNILFEGETNRAIAAHSLNKVSSRSHCIFTIHIESRSCTDSNAKYIRSKLNLVDLAGSERLSKTGSEGKTQQEAMYINKSLTFLEQTIVALADRRREHVPYRQTKLTHALKDSLGGNCETIMIANIWGEASQIEETISTLRFATRMMCIAINPGVNEYYDPTLLVKKLEKEIKHLKHELTMHDTLANRSHVSYEALSDTQLMEIEDHVRRYMEGTLDEIDVVNVRQVQAVFDTFKNIAVQMESDIEARLRSKYTLIDRSDPEAVANAQKAGLVFDESGGAQYVGEVDGQGFGLGTAPASAKPAHSAIVSAKRAKSKKGKDRGSPQPKGGTVPSPVPVTQQPTEAPQKGVAQPVDSSTAIDTSLAAGSATKEPPHRPDTPPLRTVAFEEFKKERGSEINRILNENKEILSSKKKVRKDLTTTINLTKQEIDEKRQAIERLRLDKEEQGEYAEEDGEVVISEEEFQMIKTLKELKASYRSDYQEMRQVNSEIQYCQKLVDQCRQRLISEFDNWYSECFLQTGDDTTSAQDGVGARPGTLNNNLPEDEGEKFERLQSELLQENQNSAAFYKARMRTDRRQTLEAALQQAQPDPPKRKVSTPTVTVRNKPPSMMTIQT